MSSEFLKEKISWYKLLFTLTATALVASIGWIVSNTDYPLKFVIALNALGIAILAGSIAVFIYKIRFYLKKMEEK